VHVAGWCLISIVRENTRVVVLHFVSLQIKIEGHLLIISSQIQESFVDFVAGPF